MIGFCLDIFYRCTFALFNNCMIFVWLTSNRRAVSAGAFSTWWQYRPPHSQYYKNQDHNITLEREAMQWHWKSHINVAFVISFITRGKALVMQFHSYNHTFELGYWFLEKYWETWCVQFLRRRCQQTQIWGAIQRQGGCTMHIVHRLHCYSTLPPHRKISRFVSTAGALVVITV